MIQIKELKLDLKYDDAALKSAILNELQIEEEELRSFRIVRRSIDARKKQDIHYVLTVDVEVAKEKPILKRFSHLCHTDPVRYHFPKPGTTVLTKRPVVIGSGPAGLLASYELALHGYRPILLERGCALEERREAVRRFWKEGIFNPDANAQFGEGGAGTFSDGKLNTSVYDREGRNREVLELFVKMGADPDILIDARPHIGTDGLFTVLKNLRKRIIELGGTVMFQVSVTSLLIENGRLFGVVLKNGDTIETDIAVLAIGHSARDTFRMLRDSGIMMEQKPFAIGLRVEHPQEMIDLAQYGFTDHGILPAAPYKLTFQSGSGRGVYSFCMCPGGFVVNASSELFGLCVNGMSYAMRDGKNANSAVVVQTDPSDYGSSDPLAGVYYQEKLERMAYTLCSGRIPQQLLTDFKHNRESHYFGDYETAAMGEHAFGNLRDLLPEFVSDAFLAGMEDFGKKISGFDREDTILSGIESRTSSPVRIVRDHTGQSSVKGLYPAGEGAGYAGGILSAAIDGIRQAEKIALQYIYKGNQE